MHPDDEQVGRVLTRREVLALLGAGGVSMLGGGTPLAGLAGPGLRLPACIVRPRQTDGPYFLDDMLERADIRTDPTDGSVCEGMPLDLAFRVSSLDGGGCRPLPGAVLDIWQCDAVGVYSGVEDIIGGLFDTRGKSFLRGYQITDTEGVARFRTIFPGWYQGRTVHIHFKIRTAPDSEAGHEFTSQVYFADAVADRVLELEPYASHDGEGRMRNAQDQIYRSGGDQLLLDVEETGDGYAAAFDIGLQIG